ncbi:MAG TPA: catalase/peroxidase HPI, partial [Ornithinibacter sp.]|nr:catalase/peroxidase HPI [Ornithinibacter sp.]
DLLVFAGNVALEDMGFETFGFGFGRPDVWEPEEVFWGPEDAWLGDERYSGDRELTGPFGAVQMGLIYVNPEGPNGEPDPVRSARDIRETFARMAMDDEETVALIAGGHTFGKTHGAGDPELVGTEPEGCPVNHMGIGWKSLHGSGKGRDTITSGLEVTWTQHPTRWSNEFFENLFGFEWELTKSPAGAHQWQPKGGAGANTVPDPEDGSLSRPPTMLTTDLALRFDPTYEKISRRFLEHPDEFALAFGKAWYKLLHRDMGPIERYLGPWVPEPQLWQDPVPAVDHELVSDEEVASLKEAVLGTGLTVQQLVRTAWASAATFRGTDKRGGANGARIRLEPQRGWESNDAAELDTVLSALERVKADFDGRGGAKISLADLIVLAGNVGVEKAAADAGHRVTVPFHAGRTDASQDQTDIHSFRVLQPRADGFRSYLRPGEKLSPETLLLDRANLLTLTAPEMTVLLGGMRAIGANVGDSDLGVLTERRGQLTNDVLRSLLAPGTEWKESATDENVFEGTDIATGRVRWTATAADLVFGSHAQLRALAEVYASDDAQEKFVRDFVAAWVKVMELDRFDLR